jgi:hypothetical protein
MRERAAGASLAVRKWLTRNAVFLYMGSFLATFVTRGGLEDFMWQAAAFFAGWYVGVRVFADLAAEYIRAHEDYSKLLERMNANIVARWRRRTRGSE